VKYEASGGYISYQYKFLGNKLTINFTGTGTVSDWEILLPQNKKPKTLQVNSNAKSLITNKIESSEYLVFSVDNLGVSRIEIDF
jgi:hypothetical protein